MFTRFFRLWVCLLILVGCSQQSETTDSQPRKPDAGGAEDKAASAENEASVAEPGQDRPNLDAAAVQSVLDAWRDAQNNGDFEAYSSLYARRTYGEKRAGTRVYRFNREGWLLDRKRMFARPTSVTVRDVVIKASPSTAEVLFEQTFSQAGFRDSGRKRITMIREDGELKISTEVMLSSSLLTDSPELAKDFHFVLEAEGRSYVVLADRAKHSWGSGTLAEPIVLKNGLYVVFQSVTDPPHEHASWPGKPLKIYALDGASCETKIERLALMAAVVPHFGVVQMWRGEDQPGAKPWAPAQIAQSLFADESGESLSLVAEVRGCKGAFATSPERAVRVMPKLERASVTDAAALEALRKLPVYRSAQAEFERAAKQDRRLKANADWSEWSQTAAYGPDSELIGVAAGRGAGCGDYSDTALALFRSKEGRLEPLSAARPAPRLPYMVLDLDADGALELLLFDDANVGSVLGRIGGTSFLKLKRFPYSYQDCGC